MGKLLFGRVTSWRDVVAETGKIGFIKNPQYFLILRDIFAGESDNFIKKEMFHEKVLVSVNLSGNALENNYFYNIRGLPCYSEDFDSVI